MRTDSVLRHVRRLAKQHGGTVTLEYGKHPTIKVEHGDRKMSITFAGSPGTNKDVPLLCVKQTMNKFFLNKNGKAFARR